MGNRVVLVGAVHEARAAFESLATHPDVALAGVVTLTDEAAGRVSGFVDLGASAGEYDVPVLRVSDVNAPESVTAIGELHPDLLAVVGWTRLIGDELLAMPRAGCVGFHASLLPYGRGRAPVNWSILRGDPVAGNTMMLLNAGVDTGLVVDQRATPIYLDDTCASVYDRVARLGGVMLHDNVLPLLEGRATARAQDPSRATTFPKRTPAMGVTDWRLTPVEVHNWIRALTQPYPGAFTLLAGAQVMLWASEPPMRHSAAGADGQVLELSPEGMRVAAGGGSLLVTSVGAAGHPPQRPVEAADALGLRVGARFELPDEATSLWARGLGPRPEERP